MMRDWGLEIGEKSLAKPLNSITMNVREVMATVPVIERHIEADPGVRGGKPRIVGRRITVADIVLMHQRMGQSLDEISVTYDLPLSAVYAAMAYYFDHKQEIDQSIVDDEAFIEAFRRDNPSKLRAKLAALKES